MSTASSLFALIIGINLFPSEPGLDLKRAVSDAKSMRDFLQNKLNVPSVNICLLLDKEPEMEATHSNIISAFRSHFINNPAILKDESSMLFYFAGHGTSYGDGEYEAICTVNREEEGDIEDWHIGELLDELATKKGNNITVIMDCCHSGSGTRAGISHSSSHFRPRWAPPLEHPPSTMQSGSQFRPDTIRALRSDPSAQVLYLSSHVLLAACRQDELAYEYTGVGGVFTTTLLRILSNKDITRITNDSLISDIQSVITAKYGDSPPIQTPQCEGVYKRRIIFDSKAMGVNLKLVPIRLDSMRVEAGEIHGIVTGTEFVVRRDQLHSSHDALGSVVATEVHAVWSVVAVIDGGTLAALQSPGAFAMVTFWANHSTPYKIRIQDSRDSTDFIHRMNDRLKTLGLATPGEEVCIVNDDNSPDLMVSIHSDHCIFDRRDGLSQANSLPNLQLRLVGQNDDLHHVSMAGRFHYHLSRENAAHPYQSQISISLIHSGPDGPLAGRKNLVTNGHVTLVNDPSAKYVFVVENNSSVDLWCTLLYFDPTTYTIQKLYAPPSPSMPPPLRQGMAFTVGQRNSGVPPFGFAMDAGAVNDRDVGFVKLFVSEEYADLSMLEQVSGFQYQRPWLHRDGPSKHEMKGSWDSFITVIDVRKGQEHADM